MFNEDENEDNGLCPYDRVQCLLNILQNFKIKSVWDAFDDPELIPPYLERLRFSYKEIDGEMR